MKNKTKQFNHFQARVYFMLRRDKNNAREQRTKKDKTNDGNTSLIGKSPCL